MTPLYIHQKHIQVIVLVILSALVMCARQIREYGGLFNAASAVVANCEFRHPKLYAPIASSANSPKWCMSADRDATHAVINHMKIRCKNDACIAAEFGSNVAIAYSPFLDMIFINPSVETPGSETADAAIISCEFESSDGSATTERVQSPIQIKFITDEFTETKKIFKYKAACIIHAMLRKMY